MTMPSEIDEHISIFDRLADSASRFFSQAPFFAVCVLTVVIWAFSYFLIRDLDTWQLIINTGTTIVTFLMVALLNNSQHRADKAIQHKLNAIADGMADMMSQDPNLDGDGAELRHAVGLEGRESSSD